MSLSTLVYSTDSEIKKSLVPVSYSKRAGAPELGEVFTAQVIKRERSEDLVVDRINNYTGYIKKNLENPIEVNPGEYSRFKIVAGPYTKNRHNYFYVAPLRKIGQIENKRLNKIDPQTFLFINRLGEFLIGLGWNREQKRYYRLPKEKDWGWFCKTFEVH